MINIPKSNIKEDVECTGFEGSPVYNIVGMYFLNHNHPNLCIISGQPYVSNHEIKTDESHIHDDSCVVPPSSFSAIPKKQTGVSLRWIEETGSISVPHPEEEFWKFFNNCIAKRFIALPFGFNCNKFGHANYLLFDRVKKTLERFESFGKVTDSCLSNPNVDREIEKLFREKLSTYAKEYAGFRYVKPSEIFPDHNIQSIQESETEWENRKTSCNPVGFCSVWSIWYIELRVSNPDIEPKKLIRETIDNLLKEYGSLTNFIRNYSLKLVDLHEKFDGIYKRRKSKSDGSSLSMVMKNIMDGGSRARGKTSGKKKKKSVENNFMNTKKSVGMRKKIQKKSVGLRKKSVVSAVKKSPTRQNFVTKFLTKDNRGFGVKALIDIPSKTTIAEYGSVRYKPFFKDDCKKCENKKWPCFEHSRLMKLPDDSWLDCDKNCLAGYINHSKRNPNCGLETVFNNKTGKYHVFIKTIKNIPKDSELNYNYFN